MTSHTLASFKDRPLASQADCTFCQIASGSQPCHKVYEDEETIAFLDILPLRRGHTLVVPKKHVDNLSALDEGYESVLKALVLCSRGVGAALGDERLQVITNQGYAQIVPHLHFHIVPAPPLPGDSARSTTKKQNNAKPAKPSQSLMAMLGHGREELDDDEGAQLAKSISKAVQEAKAEAATRQSSKL